MGGVNGPDLAFAHDTRRALADAGLNDHQIDCVEAYYAGRHSVGIGRDPREFLRIAAQPGEIDGSVGVGAQLYTATETRALVPGCPDAGPYPTAVGEVADEVLAWVKAREDDASVRGLTGAIASRLLTAADSTLPVAFDEDGDGAPLWLGEDWSVRPLHGGEVEVTSADDSHPGNGAHAYVFEPEVVAAIAAAHRLGEQPEGGALTPTGPGCSACGAGGLVCSAHPDVPPASTTSRPDACGCGAEIVQCPHCPVRFGPRLLDLLNRGRSSLGRPADDDELAWRSRFYAAFADVPLVRRGLGLLNVWRAPDAPEMDRMARVATTVVTAPPTDYSRAPGGEG